MFCDSILKISVYVPKIKLKTCKIVFNGKLYIICLVASNKIVSSLIVEWFLSEF